MNSQSQAIDGVVIENKFMIPYERNPQFIGKQRKQFLGTIRAKLMDEVEREFNHRIALHGLGGIGKTQCALEYVYVNKCNYERIYWISAVDQTSILSGYQNIARGAGLGHFQACPTEVVEMVKIWLSQQQNWLVVIDNLDDYQVANGFLPENGPEKHTLVTTRNPYTSGIPAEALAVPLLDEDDSVELLLTLSRVASPSSEQREEARKIVDELGMLPLAIKQAAAYINTVTGDLSFFLEEYRKNRAGVHDWPTENPQYPFNVASTWSMSFDILRHSHPPAARLLQLFSYMNPDGIQFDFLLAGAGALEDDLKRIVSSENGMAKSLLELEKFSFINWDRPHRLISIHRLVQMVVSDGMTDEEKTLSLQKFVKLCRQAFPREVTNDTRPICRKYQSQVVEPLLRLTGKELFPELAFIIERVGWFLSEDGKYRDGESFLLRALEISSKIFPKNDRRLLGTKAKLVALFIEEGRYREAATLAEETLKIRKKVLKKDDPSILTSTCDLALIYRRQGRLKEAIKLLERVLKEAKQAGRVDHPIILTVMNNFANAYRDVGRTAEVTQMLEDVLKGRRRLLTNDNPNTILSMHNLAVVCGEALGRRAEAIQLENEALAKSRTVLGDEHPHTIYYMETLAYLYRKSGAVDLATSLEIEISNLKQRLPNPLRMSSEVSIVKHL